MSYGNNIDPVTIEVLRNRFDAIANNMETTLIKCAYSTIIKEAADCSVALFDRDGNTIAQGVAIPVHLGSLPPAVKTLLKQFPVETLKEGDAVAMNDPYAGGQHYPDIIVVVPVIFQGKTVALAASLAHHQDIGGTAPGSTPTDATTVFEEGLCIPPLKLVEGGALVPAIEAIIRRNVRFPDLIMGDIKAQIAAGQSAASELGQLVASYGADVILAAMQELLKRAEMQTRACIERIPDGKYTFTDWLDNDGIDEDRRIPIRATVKIDGSDIYVDFTGTSPQVRGPINSVPSVALSAVRYIVRVISGPEIPNNEGCYRMIHLSIPEGSVLNPKWPAAVNSRAVTLRRVVDTMLGALAQALPGQLPAASNGHPLWAQFGGVDENTGDPYIATELGTGGMGARPTKDGIDCIQTDTSNSMNLPIEVIETTAPLRVNYYRIRRDSGGAGRFRGGCGFAKEFDCLTDNMRVSHRGERHFVRPWGLLGGGEGAASESYIVTAAGKRTKIPSKKDFELNRGDRLIVLTSGGGGHGSALDRPPAEVLGDVLNKKVSVKAARESYSVVIRGTRMNAKETEALRSHASAGKPDAGVGTNPDSTSSSDRASTDRAGIDAAIRSEMKVT